MVCTTMIEKGTALLSWAQLHDSSFPAGRFVHSNGLESWLRATPSADDQQIAALARSYLDSSVAPLDGVACAQAWSMTSADALAELDAHVFSFKLSGAARSASTTCGRQLAATATRVIPALAHSEYLTMVGAEEAHGNSSVVEGYIQHALGISQIDSVAGHLQTSFTGFLSAAVRLGRGGPLWMHREIFAQHGEILRLARRAVSSELTDIYGCAMELDIHAMSHERVRGRQFMT